MASLGRPRCSIPDQAACRDSIAGSSRRSSSHIACNTSAIALSRRFAGKAASQAAYSACRPTSVPMWCRASAGHGCDGRLDDRCGSPVCQLSAPRGSGPGVRHPSWASRRLIDRAWVPLRSDTSRNEVRRIRRRPADAGRSRRWSSWPRRSAPFCSPARPRPACAAGAGAASAASPWPVCCPVGWRP